MRARCFLIVFLWLAGISAAHAGNTPYRCEPGTVANDAVAIAFPDVDVAAFSDPDNDICTFAIGGATIDGPTRGEVSPIAEILGRLESTDVEPLVLRLLIPRSLLEGENRELEGAIGELLKENLEALLKCVAALENFDSGVPEPKGFSDLGAFIYLRAENDAVTVECSLFKPESSEFLRSTVPVLRLYSRTGDKSDSLYVPAPALK